MRYRSFWPGFASMAYWLAAAWCGWWLFRPMIEVRHTPLSMSSSYLRFVPDEIQFIAAVCVLVSFPFVAMHGGRYVRRREQQWRQRRRDRLASEFLDAYTTSGGQNIAPPPFCLYLRPFHSTGTLRICVRSATSKQRSPWSGEYKSYTTVTSDDFEVVLAESLEPVMPLVALGTPGESLGAGRLASDDAAWQANFERLSQSAAAIVLVPSLSPGTQCEMTRILGDQSLLKKTVFVIPPIATFPYDATSSSDVRHLSRYGFKQSAYRGDLRTDSIKAIARLGVELKVPKRNGCLVFFGRNDAGHLFWSWQTTLGEHAYLAPFSLLHYWFSLGRVWTFSRAHLRKAIVHGIARRGAEDMFPVSFWDPGAWCEIRGAWSWLSSIEPFPEGIPRAPRRQLDASDIARLLGRPNQDKKRVPSKDWRGVPQNNFDLFGTGMSTLGLGPSHRPSDDTTNTAREGEMPPLPHWDCFL